MISRTRRTCTTAAEAPRTYACSWCGRTTGLLPADTAPADRICDACVDGRLMWTR
ncbi:hypothetical protein [Nocardiopsis sp. NPDC006938]|uniref:hypothetical protein n=1 Tax=Nocardiopsis sp. NPDC006938 TaxID=3364337 RepID=UPI00368A083E